MFIRISGPMDVRERERSQDMFYRGPTVGGKYTYQNQELGHVRVDVAKVGS